MHFVKQEWDERRRTISYKYSTSSHFIGFIFQIRTRIVKLKCDCVSFHLVSRAENSAPTDGFLRNSLKTVFRRSRVLLKGLWKCILSSAIKFVPVWSFQGNLSLFSDSSLNHIFESKNFRFPSMRAQQIAYLGSYMRKIKLQQIVRNSFDKLRKLYLNGTVIQKFLAILKLQEILGNFCFSEQVFGGKQSLSASVKWEIS